MSWQIMAIALNLLIAGMAILGCIQQRESGLGMFHYYTTDSNVLAAVACLALAVCQLCALAGGGDVPAWAYRLKYVASCCLSVTFLVVLFVLAPTFEHRYTSAFLEGAMLYHHLLCPLLCVASFLLFDRLTLSPAGAAWLALIPTAVYAVTTLLLNLLRVMEGPYPFLHVYEQPWQASALWFCAIVGGAWVVAWALALPKQ